MQKIDHLEKQEIVGGIFGSTLITLMGVIFGGINLIGAITAGAMNISDATRQANEQKPKEPLNVNSVFTNTFSSKFY
ncbi:MAG: hypothetical protein ACRC42_01430 [Mycoplasma sp.]